MSRLIKNLMQRVEYVESTTTTTGTVSPTDPPATGAVPSTNPTPLSQFPYTRLATWSEVRAIWPWLTACGVQKRLLLELICTPIHGTTIYRQLSLHGAEIRDGGRLSYTWYSPGFMVVQKTTSGSDSGIGFCVVVGQKSDIKVFTNPMYNPDFGPEDLEGPDSNYEGALSDCA